MDQAEPVGADREAADHETDQPGEPEAGEDDRPEQDDREQQEKLEHRAVRRLEREQRDHSSVLISGTSWTLLPSQRSVSLPIVPSAWKWRIAESTISRLCEWFGRIAARPSWPLSCPITWKIAGSSRARPSATGRSSRSASARPARSTSSACA